MRPSAALRNSKALGEAFLEGMVKGFMTYATHPRPKAKPSRVAENASIRMDEAVGPGRPALPVGSVRFWEKEGQRVAMVKIAQPDVWVHKKKRASAAPSLRGHKAAVGTVRAWKRRKVVKTGAGWIRHSAKTSQESATTPQANLQEQKEASRARLRDRLLAASDSRVIAQEAAGNPTPSSRRDRLRARASEVTHAK